jgi:hypothetical protein
MGGEERRAKSLRNGVHLWRTRSRGDQCEENAPEATRDSTPHATTPSSGSDGGASEGGEVDASASFRFFDRVCMTTRGGE